MIWYVCHLREGGESSAGGDDALMIRGKTQALTSSLQVCRAFLDSVE